MSVVHFSWFFVEGSIVTESIVPMSISFVEESNVARPIIGVHPSVCIVTLFIVARSIVAGSIATKTIVAVSVLEELIVTVSMVRSPLLKGPLLRDSLL